MAKVASRKCKTRKSLVRVRKRESKYQDMKTDWAAVQVKIDNWTLWQSLMNYISGQSIKEEEGRIVY